MQDFDLIVAVGLNGVIGNSVDNSIPWYLPRDLKHFKNTTMDRPIIMGSTTWRSLPVQPLPKRRNVVISRQEIGFVGADAQYSSLEEALNHEENAIVIGGGAIYAACMKFRPTRMFVTIVHTDAKGDVLFVASGDKMLASEVLEIDGIRYQTTESNFFSENGYDATIKTYTRME